VAQRQHGNVTHEQLLELGLRPRAIQYRLRVGRLHRVHRRVYAVGRPPMHALERAMAAVLACGEHALLSHRAALALWDLGRWPTDFDVTVPRERRHPGIRIHRCSRLSYRDARRRHGIPVTSPARALLHCAPGMTDPSLRRAVNAALRAKIMTRGHLAELLSRWPIHPGTKLLRPFAAPTGQAPTRSRFEDDFLAFCARYDIPEPRVNSMVGAYEVDAYFEAQKVIVELDSWGFHNDRETWAHDRERDTQAYADGIGTVRITWERLHDTPEREAARLRKILRL
jgi:hypothetical protein